MTELQVTFSHSITKDYYHEVSSCSGLTSWRAGECLSSWLDSQPDLLSGRSVLELGSGSGITGIFAVKRVPHITSFTFTDCHPKVLANLRLNVTNNLRDWSEVSGDSERLELRLETGSEVVVTDLDWSSFSESPGDSDISADVILGADIVFDPDLIPSLVTTIRILLSRSDQGLAVIACCVRNKETFEAFERTVSDQMLQITKEVLNDSTPPVFLLKITLR